jgi:hypothetical protein
MQDLKARLVRAFACPQARAVCCSAASSNERVDEDAGKRRRFAACAGFFRRFDEAVHGGFS